LRHWRRGRFSVLSVTSDDRDRLLVAVRQVRPVRVMRRRLRSLVARLGRKLGGSRS
jgi:hypothetical protein